MAKILLTICQMTVSKPFHLITASLIAVNFCCGKALAFPQNVPLLPASIDISGTSQAQLINTVNASPDLKIHIYTNSFTISNKSQDAWSYVTDGLEKVGQEEIVLTVLKGDDEQNQAFPQLPIKLFASIESLAKQKKVVNVGGYTEFRTQGFLAPQFKGLIYTRATALQGVPLPANCIAMVPVTKEEMEVYQTAGPSRVMARLGREAQFFPCPTWCDRARKSSFNLAEIAEMKDDPIFRSAKAHTFSLTALQNKDHLALKVNPKTSDLLLDLLNQLPKDSALRLALGIDPQADALLVWESKQNGNRSMIAPSSSGFKKIAITFIALLPGMSDNEILSGSDGCALMMTQSDYNRFREALTHKRQFDLKMNDKSMIKNFSIDWADQ